MNQQDLNQISARGISEQQIEHQLEQIKNGFPFLKLEGAAAIGKGIMAPTAQEVEDYEKAWNDYKVSERAMARGYIIYSILALEYIYSDQLLHCTPKICLSSPALRITSGTGSKL